VGTLEVGKRADLTVVDRDIMRASRNPGRPGSYDDRVAKSSTNRTRGVTELSQLADL
jgi:hypothetical protein